MKKFVTTLITILLIGFGAYYFLSRRNVSLADRAKMAVSNIKNNLKGIGNEVSDVAKKAAETVKKEAEEITSK